MNEGLLNYNSEELRSSGIDNGTRQRSGFVNNMSNSTSSIHRSSRVNQPNSQSKGRDRTDSQRELENFGFKGVINESEDGWGAVSNLDVFFGNMYHFYHNRGLTTIITSGISHIITLAFTVLFSTFLFSFVRWRKLWKCRDEQTCAPHASDYTRDPFDHTTFLDVMVFIWFVLFTMYWAWTVFTFILLIRDASDMAILFKDKLDISNRELQTIEWHEVVSRLEALQRSGKYTIAITGGSFTARDIACRIMRKENYLIAMINKGVLPLQLPLPKWPPPPLAKLWNQRPETVDSDYHTLPNMNENSAINVNSKHKVQEEVVGGGWFRLSKRSYFTGTLEWVIHVCLLNYIHDDSFTVNQDFIRDSTSLRRRFFRTGCVYIALMPFILVFMVTHFFLKNAQEWHSKKNYLGPRQWDHLALWHFREFNELPHVFERRLALSYEHAGKYTRRFHSPALAVAARAVSFITGSFIGVMLLLTLIDDDAFLFHVALNDHNLLWHLGILSAIFAVSIGFGGEPPDEAVMDADEMMGRVAEHTHYFPESWRRECASHAVRDEFLSIFKFKAQLFAEEVLVVLLAPYMLCQTLPDHSDKILAFIDQHTVNVDGLGGVCAFSLFDFKRYGDERYAAPADGENAEGGGGVKIDRTEQGKLEKSFLNFKMNHPDWQCGPEGDAFMQNLCDFQEREVVTRRQQQAASLLASQLHVSQVLQSSMLRQSQQYPPHQPRVNVDIIPTFDNSEEKVNRQETTERMVPPPLPNRMISGRSGSASVSSHMRAFPSIPEDMYTMNNSSPDLASPDLTAEEGGESALASGPDRIIRIDSSASPPPAFVTEPESPLLKGQTDRGQSLNDSLGGNLSHFNLSNLGQSDLALSSVLSGMQGSMQGSVYKSMRGEPRTVEAMIQSALREESQSMLLRDVMSRRSAGGGTSQLLDSNNEASFYWLDKYREESSNKLRNSMNVAELPGGDMGGSRRSGRSDVPSFTPQRVDGSSQPPDTLINTSSGSSSSGSFCFKCGQSGHLSNNCPRSKAVDHSEMASISQSSEEEEHLPAPLYSNPPASLGSLSEFGDGEASV